MNRVAWLVLCVAGVALAQAQLGDILQLKNKDENTFPTGASRTGGLYYGTDAGRAYISNGATWEGVCTLEKGCGDAGSINVAFANVTFDNGPVASTTVSLPSVTPNTLWVNCIPSPTTDAGATEELYLAAHFSPIAVTGMDAGSFVLNVWSQNGVVGTFSFRCLAVN